LFGRAVALGFLKRHADALAAWDDALAVASGDNRTSTLTARRNSLASYADQLVAEARKGKAAGVVERAAVFDRETDLPGPTALAVARLYALAAASAPEAKERGAKWLGAAHKAGAFAGPAARKRLAEDREFEPLRGTEAFRQAIGETPRETAPAPRVVGGR
jgi:hypothetical protein